MERLHSGAKWKFRIGGYVGLLILLSFFAVPVFFMVSETSGDFSLSMIYILIGIVFVVVLIEIFTHLTYINWKYEFTSDSLKIENGIIVKKYKSIPYERVQNVDITRGILARILGFSTLNIQTAGYSFHQNASHASEGHIPAVSVESAEKIREFLMKKIAGKKNSGI